MRAETVVVAGMAAALMSTAVFAYAFPDNPAALLWLVPYFVVLILLLVVVAMTPALSMWVPTLLGLVSGTVEPTAGRVKRGKTVQFGFLDQQFSQLAQIGSDRVRGASLTFESLYFVGMLLFVITFALNLLSDAFVRRVRRSY